MQVESLEPRLLLATVNVAAGNSIQDAIDAAASGDTILVAPGTYQERLVIAGGKRLQIESTGGADVTTIDATNDPGWAAVLFQGLAAGSGAAGLKGFTVTGSHMDEGGQGGVTVVDSDDVIIENCILRNNDVYDGGGILVGHATVTIRNNRIIDNTVARHGGGIYVVGASNVTIEDNTISGNRADGPPTGPGSGPGGGGILIVEDSTGTIRNNQITDNFTLHVGGGICLLGGATMTITDNTITGNQAAFGGGIHVESGTVTSTISHNTITGNSAFESPDYTACGDGGGISIYGESRPVVSYNEIGNNTAAVYGGGIVMAEGSQSTLLHNHIYNNHTTRDGSKPESSGGGLSLGQSGSSATLIGNLIEGNAAPMGGGMTIGASSVAILEDNTFLNNTGDNGGGGLVVDGQSQATVTGNIFAANVTVYEGQTWSMGGNVQVANSSTAVFTSNLLRDGRAVSGGGMYVHGGGMVTLQNNTVVNNYANAALYQAGGITFAEDAGQSLVRNNIVAGNNHYQVEEAATNGTSVVTWDTNFIEDTGDGMYFSWNTGVLHSAQAMNDSAKVLATGTLSGSPGFVAPGENNYSLRPDSVCVNAGNPSGAPAVDINGFARTNVDLGAYEYVPFQIVLSNNRVAENSASGTAVGTLSTTDPMAGDSASFTLLNNAGGRFKIQGQQLQVDHGSLLDYEAAGSYVVSIQTAAPDGADFVQEFTITITDRHDFDSVAVFSPAASTFYLRSGNSSGSADFTFGYGEPNAGWITLVGDWDGDGSTGVGLYAPESSTFYLTSAYVSGYAEYTFGYGEPGAGWIPLVGDWDGNGSSGVGLYNPSASTFYLTNTLQSGYAEYTFGYGEPGAGWTPLVGDWDGNGSSGVGLYNPHASTFYLTNTLQSGYAEHTFGYGEPSAGWQPLVGDWNGNGASGVGLYDPRGSTFYLTDTLSSGYAEYTFGYGEPSGGWLPLVGDWNGDGRSGVGLYDASGATFYLSNALATGVAEAIVQVAGTGQGWVPLVGCWTQVDQSLSAAAVDQVDLAKVASLELARLNGLT
jgi:parallel beta-helix repeat protein